MELPALLPENYRQYSLAQNESALTQLLINNPIDIIPFFEFACDDETWSEQHLSFIEEMIVYFTTLFFEERLPFEIAIKIAKTIQKHFSVLQRAIPCDLQIETKKEINAGNSFLIACQSEVLHDLMRHFKGKNKKIITLKDAPSEMSSMIIECAHTGSLQNIWKLSKEDLIDVLRQATLLKFRALMDIIQETLKRYITSNNVIEMLLMAHKESWEILREACFTFINSKHLGIHLGIPPATIETQTHYLVCEFTTFSDRALEIFEKIRHWITHLVCGGRLINEPLFGQILQRIPKLRSLDIGRSQDYSEYLIEVPNTLQELNLSQSPWLNQNYLKKIIGFFPKLQSLIISSNPQLTFASWMELQHLKELANLNISNCHQIKDEDFSLILKACEHLTDLNLEGCNNLTDRAFFELSRFSTHLLTLNVSKTDISDGILLEIAMRCSQLQSLFLARCTQITDTGLMRAIKQFSNLKVLDLQKSSISKEGLQKIQSYKPYLKVVSS